jgi:hypothetical protein
MLESCVIIMVAREGAFGNLFVRKATSYQLSAKKQAETSTV